MAKTITPQLLAELQQGSTKLARLFKIIVTLPAAATPIKTLRITDHDQPITFPEPISGAVTINIPGKTWPWDPNIGGNPAFYFNSPQTNTPGTAPIVVAAGLAAGQTLVVSAVTGTVTAGSGFTPYGPVGGSYAPGHYPGDVSEGHFPLESVPGSSGSGSTSSPIGLVGVVGAFTDGAGHVMGSPVAIGAGGTFVVPAGATQFQVGLNDNNYQDNTGSFNLTISGITQNEIYQAAGGFTSSAVDHKSDASPDNLELTHFLESDLIDEADLRAGLYDYADITLCVVSWLHPEYGPLKVIKGTLGQVSLKNGLASTEIRGLTQKLSTNLASTFGPTCRAELFDGKLSTGDNVAFPGTPWRCRKDPTAYTANRSVASSPDAITIVPNTALPTPSFTANQGTAITLNGQPVTAKFYTHGAAAHGAFDLQFGGTVGNPEYFGSTSHPSVQASGSGNSLNFNGGTEYSSVPVISPLNWAVLDNGGHVLSWSQPWVDATENYDMIVYGQLNIPTAGNYTFNVAHDDGCMFAMIPDVSHPNDVVTVVTGSVCPPLNQPTNPLNQTLTAYNGYSFGQYHDYVGGTGDHGSGSRYVACNNKQGNNVDQWTLHFPAAGVYLFEFGWTNFEHRQRLWVTVQGQANDLLPSNIGSGTNPVSGWYENGLVRFTSGALKDWTFDIQELDISGNIKLFAGNPMPFAPQAGDTFIVQTGCNKLTSDCFYKYGNVVNFQGENAMPGNFVLLQTPDLK